MTHYTPEEVKPSENTLSIIRQIARAYYAIKKNGRNGSYCMN